MVTSTFALAVATSFPPSVFRAFAQFLGDGVLVDFLLQEIFYLLE